MKKVGRINMLDIPFIIALGYLYQMAKSGKQKNTKNKSKHTKLMNRKKNKLRAEKELRKERLKEIINAGRTAGES